MNNPLDSTAFVLIWIGFPLLAGSVAAIFFFWGMRNGQFADQERARFLPLEAGCEDEEEPSFSKEIGDRTSAGSGKKAGGAPRC